MKTRISRSSYFFAKAVLYSVLSSVIIVCVAFTFKRILWCNSQRQEMEGLSSQGTLASAVTERQVLGVAALSRLQMPQDIRSFALREGKILPRRQLIQPRESLPPPELVYFHSGIWQ